MNTWPGRRRIMLGELCAVCLRTYVPSTVSCIVLARHEEHHNKVYYGYFGHEWYVLFAFSRAVGYNYTDTLKHGHRFTSARASGTLARFAAAEVMCGTAHDRCRGRQRDRIGVLACS